MASMTARVCEVLDQGVIFWQQPWTDDYIGFHTPVNAETGKDYKGSNFFMLNLDGYIKKFQSPKYATMIQWNKLGERIKQGEKASPIIKYDVVEKEDDEGKIKKSAWLKQYWVFNESQLVGFKGMERPEQRSEIEACWDFDQFVQNTGIKVVPSHSQGAFFNPSQNTVFMPPAHSFIETEGVSAKVNFYNVLGHEVTHATGHPTRLNRNMLGAFGSKEYAEEEMIAEFGSVLLLHKFGVALVPPENSVAYAAAWSKRLKADPTLFNYVAKEATRAFEWLEDAASMNVVDMTKPANDNCLPCISKGFQMQRVG